MIERNEQIARVPNRGQKYDFAVSCPGKHARFWQIVLMDYPTRAERIHFLLRKPFAYPGGWQVENVGEEAFEPGVACLLSTGNQDFQRGLVQGTRRILKER